MEFVCKKMIKEARLATTREHAIELDLNNSQPQIFLNLLKKLTGYSQNSFPMLEKYCANYQQSRRFVQDFLGISDSEAKKYMIKLFYGSKPTNNIPFIRKLFDEIDTGIKRLLQTDVCEQLKSDVCAHLDSYLNDRKHPMYSKLAYLLAEEESKILQAIVAEIEISCKVTPIRFIYDGCIFECPNISKKHEIMTVVSKISNKFGIGVKAIYHFITSIDTTYMHT